MNFSPDQLRVIETWNRSLAVVAGAGSGKTTTLIEKCRVFLEKNPKGRLAAISFTQKSARELKERLPVSPQVMASTIHGLCLSIVQNFPTESKVGVEMELMDEAQSQLLWEKVLEELWRADLPSSIQAALEFLLTRESRRGVEGLLSRVHALSSFGVAGKGSSPLDELYRWVAERLRIHQQRRGVLSYDDLELGALEALRVESVKKYYHESLDLILVDEFQDTNPTQARLVKEIARPGLKNLVVVGDPKQSIYRFRDADVTLFEEFTSQMDVRVELNDNYRGRPKLIEFVNSVCEKVFAASQLEFHGLVPKRQLEDEAPNSGEILRIDVDEPSQFANWLKSSSYLNQESDTVLLVRRIRGNEHWFEALKQEGLQLAFGGGGFFWEDPRIRELVALLHFWHQSGNRYSGVVFFRAPWVSVPDSTLDEWMRTEGDLKEKFLADSSLPIAKLLHPLATRLAVRPGEILTALLDDQRIAEELGVQCLGLWHRVEALSSQGLGFQEVVQELRRACEEGRREAEVPAPAQEGQLRVLTLHAAKGLEFSNVILLDFERKKRRMDMPLLFWDRHEGIYLGKRTESGDRDRKDPLENQWRELEKRKNLAEAKRLFYVALTRPKDRLILVCEKGEVEGIDPEKPYAEDHWRAWLDAAAPELKAPVVQMNPAMGTSKSLARSHSSEIFKKPEAPLYPFMRPRFGVTELLTLNHCARKYHWSFIAPLIVLEGEKKGASLGSKVHRALETMDFTPLKDEINYPIEEWVQAHPLLDDTKADRVWKELSFEVPVRGSTILGTMDRVIRSEEKLHLIDFKVNARKQSEAALVAQYRLQLEVYAWALSRLEQGVQIEASLLSFQPSGLVTVPVPLREFTAIETQVGELIRIANEIIQTRNQLPKAAPGKGCRFCSFLSKCSEGSRWMTSVETPSETSMNLM